MKLTAEQVREAIFNGSGYASYDGAKYYADGINMQAIADELNTRAERTCYADEVTHRDCKYSVNRGWRERTCKPVEKDGVMRCPDCDYPLGIMSVPAFCAGCGAKVVGE